MDFFVGNTVVHDFCKWGICGIAQNSIKESHQATRDFKGILIKLWLVQFRTSYLDPKNGACFKFDVFYNEKVR